MPSLSRLLSCAFAVATVFFLGLAAPPPTGNNLTSGNHPNLEDRSPSAAAAPATVSTDRQRDEAAVRQAALDYVMALYEADPSRVERSVDRNLTKYGYYHTGNAYRGTAMTYAELHDLATTYNADERRFDPDTTAHEVVVFEVMDKTASARITAHWGVDYMHLAKVDGRWRIRNILWQSRGRNAR